MTITKETNQEKIILSGHSLLPDQFRLPENETASIRDALVHDIEQMAVTILQHPAVDNKFYELWMTERLQPQQVELFAVNYKAWVAPTVQRLARAFVNMKDLESRAEIVLNMLDELGKGNPKAVHPLLLDKFFDELLSNLYGREFRLANSRAKILPATRHLNSEAMKLFAHHRTQVACGALFAQEWHAYPQIAKIYEGSRNYMDRFELNRFHQICEYHYIHIGEAEKEHQDQSIKSAARACQTYEDLQFLRQGFYSLLDLLADYWKALYEAIVATKS